MVKAMFIDSDPMDVYNPIRPDERLSMTIIVLFDPDTRIWHKQAVKTDKLALFFDSNGDGKILEGIKIVKEGIKSRLVQEKSLQEV